MKMLALKEQGYSLEEWFHTLDWEKHPLVWSWEEQVCFPRDLEESYWAPTSLVLLVSIDVMCHMPAHLILMTTLLVVLSWLGSHLGC
jgi:murein tripeptide amidase MpaA